jgi:fatty acid desaturase
MPPGRWDLAASQAGFSSNLALLVIVVILTFLVFVLVVILFLFFIVFVFFFGIVEFGGFEDYERKRFAKQIAVVTHPHALDRVVVDFHHRYRVTAGFQNDNIAWFQFHDFPSAANSRKAQAIGLS